MTFAELVQNLDTAPEKALAIFRTNPPYYQDLLDFNRLSGIACNKWSPYPESDVLKKEVWPKHVYSDLLIKEYERIAALFNSREILNLPFKGVDLILSGLYPDTSWRSTTDIDIFVAEHQFQNAAHLLTADGYTREPLHDPLHTEQTLVKGQFTIDLHWNIQSPNRYSLPSSFILEELPWSPERRLYFLILHGCISRFNKAIWLYDLIQILRTQAIDWHTIFAYSRLHRTQSIVTLTRRLIGATLHHDPPDYFTRTVWETWQKKTGPYADNILRAMLFDSPLDLLKFIFYRHLAKLTHLNPVTPLP
ncbi:nucleotidyltransferase family protein [candidate division CSSED10-310 bacterium]|uniref:Nucleotidyltransferase family protein n=1 Tax=candidate division CSSED10-310 bacterium TaxID=2855610 RepID=A0ABV6YVV6_UNCC1